MTAHIIAPFIHVEDSNGNPIAGAVLYVYTAGTTTPAAIYSDAGLSVAVTNPLSGSNASDASGNFPRVYLASGTYKLRAQTADGTLIWEWDNIDTGLTSGSGPLSIASGGTGGTTAAAARTALGAASQSDVDDLSTDISTVQQSVQNIVSVPQGRLTPTSLTPVISSSVSAGTAVYYTPYIGNLVPIYDGTQFNATVFSELTLSLVASHLASQIYDVFIWSESGTVTIGTGPAWTVATAGSCSRGSGAGTTELARTNGLWTNANSMTMRNGSTTYTVTANKATYLGSIYMDGTNGQLSCLLVYGQSRKFGIWNAHNRVPIILKAGDATTSWTYSTATYRASNADSTNKITVFSGLAEELFEIRFTQKTIATTVGVFDQNRSNGIGWNSTTEISGKAGYAQIIFGASGGTAGSDMVAEYIHAPAIGINSVQALETASAVGSQSFYGTESAMVLSARWRG